MSNDKSLSLALEVAKRSRSKRPVGADEVRKARLHNLLFGLGDDTPVEMDAEIPDTEVVEEAEVQSTPSRKDRLMKLLSENKPNLAKKSD